MFLQLNIKDLMILFPQTTGLRKIPRFEQKKKLKIKYENEFFQQKDCDIHNQQPFFVYKMKTNPNNSGNLLLNGASRKIGHEVILNTLAGSWGLMLMSYLIHVFFFVDEG